MVGEKADEQDLDTPSSSANKEAGLNAVLGDRYVRSTQDSSRSVQEKLSNGQLSTLLFSKENNENNGHKSSYTPAHDTLKSNSSEKQQEVDFSCCQISPKLSATGPYNGQNESKSDSCTCTSNCNCKNKCNNNNNKERKSHSHFPNVPNEGVSETLCAKDSDLKNGVLNERDRSRSDCVSLESSICNNSSNNFNREVIVHFKPKPQSSHGIEGHTNKTSTDSNFKTFVETSSSEADDSDNNQEYDAKYEVDQTCDKTSHFVQKSFHTRDTESQELSSDEDVLRNPNQNRDAGFSSSSSSSSEEKTFSLRNLTRKEKLILISFCIADFGQYLCLSLIAPFFPSEASDKGVNNTISGWVFGMFALTVFLTSPIFGKLLPYAGLKFLYIAGLFLAGGATILFGFVQDISTANGDTLMFVAFCFVLRFVLGIGCAANQTAAFSLCAKAFPDSISTVFGFGEVFVGIGFMSGPAIGGFLYGWGGFRLPFLVIGGIILLTVIPNLFILPNDDFQLQADSDASPWELMKSVKTINNCLCIIVGSIVWSILDPTLEPHLAQFDLNAEMVGIVFLVMAAFYAISSPLWGWISDRMNDSRYILIPAFIFCSVGMLLLGPSELIGLEDYNQLWLNIASLVLLGTAASAAIVPTFDIFLETANEIGMDDGMTTYGIVAGLWGSMYAFGDFLGPILGGVLVDKYDFSFCVTIIAYICFAMAVILIVTMMIESKICRKCCHVCLPSKNRSQGLASENSPLLGSLSHSDYLSTFPPQSTRFENI